MLSYLSACRINNSYSSDCRLAEIAAPAIYPKALLGGVSSYKFTGYLSGCRTNSHRDIFNRLTMKVNRRHRLVDGLDAVTHCKLVDYLLSRFCKVYLPCIIL